MTAIGLYLVRCSDSGASVTLAHLVESEIADRVVTNCGHQMARRNRRGSLRTAGPLDGECSFCPPRVYVSDVPEPVEPVDIYRNVHGALARAADEQNWNAVLRQDDVPEPVASEQDDS